MQRLTLWSATLVGPCYGILLVGLIVARRFFPEAQILYELTEPILMIAAATIALAIAGLITQIG